MKNSKLLALLSLFIAPSLLLAMQQDPVKRALTFNGLVKPMLINHTALVQCNYFKNLFESMGITAQTPAAEVQPIPMPDRIAPAQLAALANYIQLSKDEKTTIDFEDALELLKPMEFFDALEKESIIQAIAENLCSEIAQKQAFNIPGFMKELQFLGLDANINNLIGQRFISSHYLWRAHYDYTIEKIDLSEVKNISKNILIQHIYILLATCNKHQGQVNLTNPKQAHVLKWFNTMPYELKKLVEQHITWPYQNVKKALFMGTAALYCWLAYKSLTL